MVVSGSPHDDEWLRNAYNENGKLQGCFGVGSAESHPRAHQMEIWSADSNAEVRSDRGKGDSLCSHRRETRRHRCNRLSMWVPANSHIREFALIPHPRWTYPILLGAGDDHPQKHRQTSLPLSRLQCTTDRSSQSRRSCKFDGYKCILLLDHSTRTKRKSVRSLLLQADPGNNEIVAADS